MVTDYILVNPNGDSLHRTFRSDGAAIWRTNAPNDTVTINFESGETPLAALARSMGHYGEWSVSDCQLTRMVLPQGHYYFRMARSRADRPSPHSESPVNEAVERELANSRGQLVALMEQLQRICQTIHPCRKTFKCYGHEIRNLLILACTEVEAQWRAILVANGMSVPGNRFNTNHYVQLAKPLRLDEYAISLPYYPWLEPIRPFSGWHVAGKPTQDLPWYDAYNAVKHDRENNFRMGTLLRALKAVCACVVMLVAQFGAGETFRWRQEFGYFFRPSALPEWPPKDLYIAPENGDLWTGVQYFTP